MNRLHVILTAVLALWLAAVLLAIPRNGPATSDAVVRGMFVPAITHVIPQ